MPTGEQLARALEKVQQLITDLPGLVAAAATSFLSTGFTTGSMTATGDVTSATGTVTGAFHNPNIITNQITTPRTSVWAQDSDGLLGWASSSRTQKDNIRDSGVDPRAVLQISSVLFNYKAELEKHALDPEYVVADEFGAIAEDLHDLGLGVVVDYWPDGSPRGINYTMLGLLAVEAAKHLDARLTAVEGRLDAAGL
ncbi:MAG TPA: hypothetical protein VNR37_03530 [Microbacteriaceae bacterium]|nr:hypothetical protein [Microbacteriaceae bacterium]